jgi:hypothetical protein
MADRFGQFDNAYSGGADIWDDGLVGQILLQDYFAPTTIIGRVKMWTGTQWAVVKAWTGSQWVAVKAWTGSEWV